MLLAIALGRRNGMTDALEADLIALDLGSTPVIAQRSERAADIWEAVFPTIMMGDDRAVARVWIAGERGIGRSRSFLGKTEDQNADRTVLTLSALIRSAAD